MNELGLLSDEQLRRIEKCNKIAIEKRKGEIAKLEEENEKIKKERIRRKK